MARPNASGFTRWSHPTPRRSSRSYGAWLERDDRRGVGWDHLVKPLALGLAMAFFLHAQTPDFYPQVRALVLEAEAASANMSLLKDRSNPHTWAGDILAHAGYLEDAE